MGRSSGRDTVGIGPGGVIGIVGGFCQHLASGAAGGQTMEFTVRVHWYAYDILHYKGAGVLQNADAVPSVKDHRGVALIVLLGGLLFTVKNQGKAVVIDFAYRCKSTHRTTSFRSVWSIRCPSERTRLQPIS